MSIYETAIDILQQKKQLFLAYEQTTRTVLTGQVEELETAMAQREQLIAEIDARTAQLAALDPQIAEAARLKPLRETLSPALQAVYDAGQDVLSVVNRITDMQPQAVQHMERIQQDLNEKMRQTATLPKIGRYQTGFGETFDPGSLMNLKK